MACPPHRPTPASRVCQDCGQAVQTVSLTAEEIRAVQAAKGPSSPRQAPGTADHEDRYDRVAPLPSSDDEP